MQEKLLSIKNEVFAQIMTSKTEVELENTRASYLGRKGRFTLLLKEISSLPEKDRPLAGKIANDVKKAIENCFNEKQKELQTEKFTVEEWFDPTFPSKKPPLGHLHLVSQAISEIIEIFERIGFEKVSYPEVEWDWYAFEGLNMPKNHPARDEWETFFIDNLKNSKYGIGVLTPHTSSGQIREMERVGKPPIRMLNIAKCYRRQSDISHSPMFYQFEGLAIEEGINITHLKGTLDYFAKSYFGKNRKTRIRPSHFQFTEPSFEIDITCDNCGSKGCRICKEGWLELGGAGIVHPNVLRSGKINPQKYQGFAFGWGVERVLMMKAGLKLPDLRILYSNDLRFLKQF